MNRKVSRQMPNLFQVSYLCQCVDCITDTWLDIMGKNAEVRQDPDYIGFVLTVCNWFIGYGIIDQAPDSPERMENIFIKPNFLALIMAYLDWNRPKVNFSRWKPWVILSYTKRNNASQSAQQNMSVGDLIVEPGTDTSDRFTLVHCICMEEEEI